MTHTVLVLLITSVTAVDATEKELAAKTLCGTAQRQIDGQMQDQMGSKCVELDQTWSYGRQKYAA